MPSYKGKKPPKGPSVKKMPAARKKYDFVFGNFKDYANHVINDSICKTRNIKKGRSR